MKKIVIGIVGILAIAASFWMWKLSPIAEKSIVIKPQIEQVTYADTFTGIVNHFKVLYTSTNQNFIQKEFIITPESKNLAKATRNNLFKEKNYVVSYIIEDTKNNFIEVKIEPKNNIFSISGVAPQSNISIWNNQNSILDAIAVDWSGKLEFNSLDKKGISLAHAQNICFYLQNEDLEICHSPIQDQGGVI